MSFCLRGDTKILGGPLRKDLYVWNGISKLRIESINDDVIEQSQVRVQRTCGAIQRYKAVFKHKGPLVATYTRDGVESFQQINPADEFTIYSPSMTNCNHVVNL